MAEPKCAWYREMDRVFNTPLKSPLHHDQRCQAWKHEPSTQKPQED